MCPSASTGGPRWPIQVNVILGGWAGMPLLTVNGNSRICSLYSQPKGALHSRYAVRKRNDFRWRLNVAVDGRMSFSSVGRRQRMHGQQFAAWLLSECKYARLLVVRGRHCWRWAVKSVMECWWPAWAGWFKVNVDLYSASSQTRL